MPLTYHVNSCSLGCFNLCVLCSLDVRFSIILRCSRVQTIHMRLRSPLTSPSGTKGYKCRDRLLSKTLAGDLASHPHSSPCFIYFMLSVLGFTFLDFGSCIVITNLLFMFPLICSDVLCRVPDLSPILKFKGKSIL